VRKWELEVAGNQLLDVWALDVGNVCDLDDLEDVNTPEPGTMSSRHILVQSLHGIRPAHLSVLFVHVVRS